MYSKGRYHRSCGCRRRRSGKSAPSIWRRSRARPGDLANLLIIRASPIDDIENTQEIVAIVHDGRVVAREALLNFDVDCTFELPTCLRR
jgi:hypothetical protein